MEPVNDDLIADVVKADGLAKRRANRTDEETVAEIDDDDVVTIRTVGGNPVLCLSLDDFIKLHPPAA